MKFSSLLSSEMARVAKRALKAEVTGLAKKISAQRTEISALRAQLVSLNKKLKSSERTQRATSLTITGQEGGKSHRFRPAGFVSLRKRLDLTQAQTAKLMGVSPITVFKWEHGDARPRAAMLAKIATLRKLGKRGATAMLQRLEASSDSSQSRLRP